MSFTAPKSLRLSGKKIRVGIAAARFNEKHVDALLGQLTATLVSAGVNQRDIETVRVPGSNELPSGLQLLSHTRKFDVLVALGVIIRGDTIHYELIANAAATALQRLALDTEIPVINGIVVAENDAQAKDRCFGKVPRGTEFALTAIEMAVLKRNLKKS